MFAANIVLFHELTTLLSKKTSVPAVIFDFLILQKDFLSMKHGSSKEKKYLWRDFKWYIILSI